MSKNYALSATKRERAGKGAARSLRRENKIPAVIYGDKKEAVKITLDMNTINLQYNKGHMFTTICDLDVEGDKHMVLARDVQLHPVTDNVEHVDFLRVTQKTMIAVNVPVHFINEDKSPGIQEKGVLNIVRFELELMCSAMDIPDAIDVDLTGKEIGDTIRISNVTLPDGVKPVAEHDFAIANLMEPKRIEEPVAEEGAEGEEGEAAEGEAGEEAKKEDGDSEEKKPEEGKK